MYRDLNTVKYRVEGKKKQWDLLDIRYILV